MKSNKIFTGKDNLETECFHALQSTQIPNNGNYVDFFFIIHVKIIMNLNLKIYCKFLYITYS